jgi:hypothetical protein
MSYREKLKQMGACPDGIEWAGERTLEQIWLELENPSWMFWLTRKLEIDHKLIVLATCGCARTALQYIPDGETRPLAAIEAAEKWANGDSSVGRTEVRYAAGAAVPVRRAADSVAYAADAAKTRAEKQCADIVREIIPLDVITEAETRQ